MSKYKNKKIEIDGFTFDSKAEATYYQQLKWLKANKSIKDFELQPKFVLQESFKKNGVHHRAITYIADFKVINLDKSVEVIDIKGFPNDVFPLKRKLFEYKFPKLTLKVLKFTSVGFIELDEYNRLLRERKKCGTQSKTKKGSKL